MKVLNKLELQANDWISKYAGQLNLDFTTSEDVDKHHSNVELLTKYFLMVHI